MRFELLPLDPPDGSLLVRKDAWIALRVLGDDPNLRIEISRGGKWEKVWAHGAPQPGYPTFRREVSPGEVEFRVKPAREFSVGNLISVRVISREERAGYEFEIGDPASVLNVVQTGAEEVSLIFSTPLKLEGAAAKALWDRDSYLVEGSVCLYPTEVSVVSPTLVRLRISEIPNGEVFRLSVRGELETWEGLPLKGASRYWTSRMESPRVARVEMQDPWTLDVFFTRAVGARATDPEIYNFTNGLQAERVQKLDSNSVRMKLKTATLPGVQYVLSVS